jgi:hypothetical protein
MPPLNGLEAMHGVVGKVVDVGSRGVTVSSTVSCGRPRWLARLSPSAIRQLSSAPQDSSCACVRLVPGRRAKCSLGVAGSVYEDEERDHERQASARSERRGGGTLGP